MENVKYKICYWYHEYQDMSASVPTCDYYRKYGECPCEPECEHFITKKEVDDIVRNMGNITDNMSDLINRQDALKPFCVAPDGTRIPEVDCDNFPVEFSVKFIKKHLMSLPSADTEWIPCSERLPAKRRSVLITTSEGFVGEACYWETTENHVIWKGYRWNATYWDDEVLAWMPLPTPYKGGDSE